MFFCVYYWVLLSFLMLFPGLTGICGFFSSFFLTELYWVFFGSNRFLKIILSSVFYLVFSRFFPVSMGGTGFLLGLPSFT